MLTVVVLCRGLLQGKETRRVKLQHSGEVIEVDEVDLEKVGGPHDCHVATLN